MFSVQSPNPTSFPDPAKALTLVTQGVGCCPYKDATCCKDHTHCCPHGITITCLKQYSNSRNGATPFSDIIKQCDHKYATPPP